MNARTTWTVVVCAVGVLAAAVLTVGTGPLTDRLPVVPSPTPGQTPTTRSAPSPTSLGTPDGSATPSTGALTAVSVLDRLAVKGRAPRTGYSRDQFGSGWATGPDGCTTRQRTLRRDLADIHLLAADPCIVTAGTLADPYTGATLPARGQALDDLTVDHV